MLVCMCLSVCFDPVPPPPGHGLCKGNLWCLWSLNHEFWQKLINQKLLSTPDLEGVGHLFRPQIRIQKDLGPMSFWNHGHPQLSGGSPPYRTPNPDLEGPGPGVLLEPGSFTFKGSL